VLPLPAFAHAEASIAIDNPITSNVRLLIHPLFLSASSVARRTHQRPKRWHAGSPNRGSPR
jgi:hypothetical protein